MVSSILQNLLNLKLLLTMKYLSYFLSLFQLMIRRALSLTLLNIRLMPALYFIKMKQHLNIFLNSLDM